MLDDDRSKTPSKIIEVVISDTSLINDPSSNLGHMLVIESIESWHVDLVGLN